jgi:hypothetical protein
VGEDQDDVREIGMTLRSQYLRETAKIFDEEAARWRYEALNNPDVKRPRQDEVVNQMISGVMKTVSDRLKEEADLDEKRISEEG